MEPLNNFEKFRSSLGVENEGLCFEFGKICFQQGCRLEDLRAGFIIAIDYQADSESKKTLYLAIPENSALFRKLEEYVGLNKGPSESFLIQSYLASQIAKCIGTQELALDKLQGLCQTICQENTQLLNEDRSIVEKAFQDTESKSFDAIYPPAAPFAAPIEEMEIPKTELRGFEESPEKGSFEGLDAEFEDFEITDQLLACVCLGQLNKQSKYEGISSEYSMQFLQKIDLFLCQQGHRPLSPDFQKISKDFLEIKNTMMALSQKYFKPSAEQKRSEELLQDQSNAVAKFIQENVFKKFKDLKTNERLLLPAGWRVRPKGHAMLFEIIKKGDSQYTFNIYNTGGGTYPWHASLEQKYLLVKGFDNLRKADLLDLELFSDLFHTEGGDKISKEDHKSEMLIFFEDLLRENIRHLMDLKLKVLKGKFQIDAFQAFLHEEEILPKSCSIVESKHNTPNNSMMICCKDQFGQKFEGNIAKGLYQYAEHMKKVIPRKYREAPILKELSLKLPQTPEESKEGFLILTDEGEHFSLACREDLVLITRKWNESTYRYVPQFMTEGFNSWLCHFEIWKGLDRHLFCHPQTHEVLYQMTKKEFIRFEEGAAVDRLSCADMAFDEPWKGVFTNWRPVLFWESGYLELPSHLDANGKALCFDLDEEKRLSYRQDPNYELIPKFTSQIPNGALCLRHKRDGTYRILIPSGSFEIKDKKMLAKNLGLLKASIYQSSEKDPREYLSFDFLEGGHLHARDAKDYLELACFSLLQKDFHSICYALKKFFLFDQVQDKVSFNQSLKNLNMWMKKNEDPDDQAFALILYHRLLLRQSIPDDSENLDPETKSCIQKLLQKFPNYIEAAYLPKYSKGAIQDLLPSGGMQELKEDLQKYLGKISKADEIFLTKSSQPIPNVDVNTVDQALRNLKNAYPPQISTLSPKESRLFQDPAYSLSDFSPKEIYRICFAIEQGVEGAALAKQRMLSQALCASYTLTEAQVCILFLLLFSEKEREDVLLTLKKKGDFAVSFQQKIAEKLDFLEQEEVIGKLKAPQRIEEELSLLTSEFQREAVDRLQLQEKTDSLRQTMIEEEGLEFLSKKDLQEEEQKSLKDLEEKILYELNKNPFEKGSIEYLRYESQKNSGQLEQKTLADAYRIFLNSIALQALRAPPFIFYEEEIRYLEIMIARSLQIKHRLITSSQNRALEKRNYRLFDDGAAFLSKKQKAMLFFEAEAGITLRPRQVNILQDCLEKSASKKSFPSIAQELMMGEGKSKILRPILAQVMADGETLPFLLVPQGLYESDKKDLQELSLRMFNQPFRTFSFSRESLKSPFQRKSSSASLNS